MLISESMQAKLNEQIKLEFDSEFIYLAMAACFDRLGLKGFSKWFYEHGAEEHGHALKFVEYLARVGGAVEIRDVAAPRNGYDDALEMLEVALVHEHHVTRKINELMALAEEEKDYATRSFLNGFVDEQVEEVEVFTEMVQMVKLAGKDHIITVEPRLAGLG